MIYDREDAVLQSGGPWDCDLGQGSIPAVPTGTDRVLALKGRAADGSIVFLGRKEGIAVTSGRDNDAGIVDCYPFVPEINAPTDGSVFEPGAMGLAWSAVAGAAEYRLIVSENSDLSHPIIDEITIDPNYWPTQLSDKKAYFWRVFAIDMDGDSGSGSQARTFVGVNACLAKLQSPTDQAVVDTNTIVFQWEAHTEADAYTLVVSENEDLSHPVIQATSTATSHTPSGLSNDKNYFWRVTAVDASQDTEISSAVWSFYGQGAFIPGLQSPLDQSVVDTETVSCQWQAVPGAANYRVIISENDDLSEPIIDEVTAVADYSPATAFEQGQLYWQVSAINSHGYMGTGSETWSFFNQQRFVPGQKTPEHGSVLEAGAIVFEWYPVGGAAAYRIIVSKNSDLSQPDIDDTTSELSHTPVGLSNAHTYYWKVFAIDAHGSPGVGSTLWSFDAHDWASLAAGGDHSLAIKPGGTLWAWGASADGQLGIGDISYDQYSPQMVGQSDDWASVAAGDRHTLALKNNGELWAWGNNDWGQLGLDDTTTRDLPTRVGLDTDWTHVAAGDDFSLALKFSGELWVWGKNESNQLGLGHSDARHTPTKIEAFSNWISVATGQNHVLALRSSGELWAWGNNDHGQLGVGDTNLSHEMRQVGSGTGWAAIAAGNQHSLALNRYGELWVWGLNTYRQLGTLEDYDQHSPVQLIESIPDHISQTYWIGMAAGGAHTLALKTGGSLYTWGSSLYGQLGTDRYGTVYPAPWPTLNSTPWTAIGAGSDHSMALNAHGQLWSWGRNNHGQLGIITPGDKSNPTLVAPGEE